jgi:hypothetical protein
MTTFEAERSEYAGDGDRRNDPPVLYKEANHLNSLPSYAGPGQSGAPAARNEELCGSELRPA